VLCIAAGFELRMLAGMLAVDAEASTYLVVVTLSLACFLGFGKRMHELLQGENVGQQRAALRQYAVGPLRWLMVANGLVTISAYLLATIDANNIVFFGSRNLVYTTVFTALGILRFGRLVSYRPEAESPTEEMLQDPPFIANLVAWFVTVVLVLYAGG
jgi:decaprenyl-phosphate phosphoribosyltransferase